MREHSGADVAFQNKTGIRSNIAAGPVSWRDAYQVSPFGNTVVSMRLKGKDLRDLCAGMLANTGKLMEVSGAVVTLDSSKPEGEPLGPSDGGAPRCAAPP